MHIWKLRKQEREGLYRFSGTLYVTQAVMSSLNVGEILTIYLDIQSVVAQKGGVDYFQVYENEAGEKLYLIDNCSPGMMATEDFDRADNHCTLLFSYEY